MTAELERYKTLCVAQEAEIARLKQGLDELKEWVKDNQKYLPTEGYSWTDYEYVDADDLLDEINRITGE